MKSNGNSVLVGLSRRQLAALPHILSSPSYEEAARRAQISPKQIHEWMKDPLFCNKLKKQRNLVFCEAISFLKTGVQKASETLIRLLDDEDPRIRLLAAEKVFANAFKGTELLDFEERISLLEMLAQQSKTS